MGVVVCNGVCAVCINPCYKGEIKTETSVQTLPDVEEKSLQIIEPEHEETGLVLAENVGTYEVTRNIFGREKVRKVK